MPEAGGWISNIENYFPAGCREDDDVEVIINCNVNW